MENLFLSPDKANHALGYTIYNSMSISVLKDMLFEWFVWAAKHLCECAGGYAVFDNKVKRNVHTLNAICLGLHGKGYSWQGGVDNGYSIILPPNPDSFTATYLQSKINEANKTAKEYKEFMQKHHQVEIVLNYYAWLFVSLLCGDIHVVVRINLIHESKFVVPKDIEFRKILQEKIFRKFWR